MATRCCCPPERESTSRSSYIRNTYHAEGLFHLLADGGFGHIFFELQFPESGVLYTLRWGKRAVLLKDSIHRTLVWRCLRDVFSSDGDDSEAVWKPAIRRNNVVLPQPEGPNIVTNSPLRTERFTSFSTALSPKYFDTCSTPIIQCRLFA